MTASSILIASSTQAQSWLTDPAGRQASWVAGQGWILIGVCTAIYLAVVAVFLIGLARGALPERSADLQDSAVPDPVEVPSTRAGRRALGWVAGASVTVVLTLFALLALDLGTRRGLAGLRVPEPRTLWITGHQYWWRVEYPDPDGDPTGESENRIETANEIHIPVDEPVLVRVVAADVIHSFWVPELAGKIDLMPEREATLWMRADRKGRFMGRCAEFCGVQHAGMGLQVVAESGEDFERWLDTQREPAREPRSAKAKEGRELFMQSACIGCHAIRGTAARGRTGPDLTHLASRSTLGAALLRNEAAQLRTWIADPHQAKPGNLMPPSDLEPDALGAIVAYLQTLE